MDLHTLILLIVAAYGLCFGIMNEKVPFLAPMLRKIPIGKDEAGATHFDRMFVCPYCTGFHTGWITWIGWEIANGDAALSGPFVAGTVTFAFASSAVCYAVDTIIQWFERE
jgi:hypothetical protein